MTMAGVTGLANKDTGDSSGDTSFLLMTRSYALTCRQNPRAMECRQAQFQGDSANSTDLIVAFDVEVDGGWGPYLQCNPRNNTAPREGWFCRGYEQPFDWPKVCAADAVEVRATINSTIPRPAGQTSRQVLHGSIRSLSQRRSTVSLRPGPRQPGLRLSGHPAQAAARPRIRRLLRRDGQRVPSPCLCLQPTGACVPALQPAG